MQSADRFTPVSDSTVDTDTADHVRRLLEEARLVESAFDPAPAPARPVTAPAAPAVPVPPPGYTLRTTHRTTADGGSEVIHEVVPLTPAPAAGPVPGRTKTAGQGLPGWLTTNERTVKAVAVLSGAGTVITAATVYGPEIAAAAAGLWAATLAVLKVIAAVIVGGVIIGALVGGRREKPSGGTFEGTFEGTVKGTWK